MQEMERTQVYLPRQLKKELQQLALEEESNLSALLRQGGEALLTARREKLRDRDAEFLKLLQSFSPSWQKRDLKEFEETRCSLDRVFPGWND